MRNQIQEITEETEMVRVLINDVQEEKRKTIESEKQRSLSFQLLQVRSLVVNRVPDLKG